MSCSKAFGTISGGRHNEGHDIHRTGGQIFFDGEPAAQAALEQRLPHLFRVDDAVYEDALRLLARAGRRLYVSLFESPTAPLAAAERAAGFGRALRDLSARRSLKIQVLSDEFFIPWNLLFDGDYSAVRVDPSSFWGFRHTIEEVPGNTRDNGIEALATVTGRPLRLGLNINVKAINKVLTDAQRSQFQRWKPGVDVLERFTEDEVLDALTQKKPQADFEYFYCHAGVEGTSEGHFDQSYLGLTSASSGLTLESIKFETVGRSFKERPIVFLNACDSARMDGRFYDGFVPKFLAMDARAVIGTDCEVPSLFAAHFGASFIEAFLAGGNVGDVLLKMRQEFLTKYQNPLGIIYRVFGNGDVRLTRPLL